MREQESGGPLVSVAADIERQHQLAQSSAAKAIEHARLAGQLLLKVKADLPHGEFLPWLAANVAFTARTAQRYMSAAAPQPKCDSLSYSPRANARTPVRRITKANQRRLDALQAHQRLDALLNHARYLSAGLPDVAVVTDEGRKTLTQLRERIDSLLAPGQRM